MPMSAPAAAITPESGRYAVLDALRGLGATHVVTFHYLHLTFSPLVKIPLVYNSWVSLEFFFVLSGFVIALVYSNKVRDLRSMLGFFVRRFGRIWPLHFVVLMSFVMAIIVINVGFVHPQWMTITLHNGPYAWTGLVSDLLLFNAMGLWNDPTWYVPAWSIGAEFYVYMVFGIVCLVSRGRLLLIAAASSALGLTVIAAYSPDFLDTDSQFGFFRCLSSFFLGVIVFHFHRYTAKRWISLAPRPKSVLATIPELAILVIVAVFCAYLDDLKRIVPWISLLSPFIFFWVVFIFSFERGYVSLALDRKAFHKLGDWSFSLYATHWPLLIVVLFFVWKLQVNWGIDLLWYSVNSRLLSALGFIPFLALVLAVSRFTFNTVEVPARQKFAVYGRKIEGAPARRPQEQRAV
jgi:peptidoglycan/LPS O-acetylase OafA/YrhL